MQPVCGPKVESGAECTPWAFPDMCPAGEHCQLDEDGTFEGLCAPVEKLDFSELPLPCAR